MVEHRLPKPRAASSNLVVRSIYCWCGSMVEHVTRNDGVVGSIPTTSSRHKSKSLDLQVSKDFVLL